MTKPIKVEHLQPCVEWWGGRDRKNRDETNVTWRVSLEDVKARGYNLDIRNPHSVEDVVGDPEELLTELDEAEEQLAAIREKLTALLEEALLR